MSNNPNDKKNIDDASLLSAAIAGAPAVGGVGYGLRDMMRQRQFRPPRESSFASAARRLQGYSYGSGPLDLDEMVNPSLLSGAQGGELARAAWMQAEKSIGKPSGALLSYASDIADMPAENVYSAIQNTVRANQSMYMRRLATRFRQNISSFTRHQALTGTLPNLIRAENFKFPSAIRGAALPPELQPVFNRIKSSLKGWHDISFYSRPGWQERGLGMFDIQFMHGKNSFRMSVPIASGGRLAEGLTQSSMRIAPDVAFYDPRTKGMTARMSRHEFLLRDFEESILPSIMSGKLNTSWDIQRAIDEMYEKNIYGLESVTNLPPHLQSQGLDAYVAAKAKAVDVRIMQGPGNPREGEVFASAFRGPTGRELGEVMEASGLIPSTSPTSINEGRLSSLDPRNLFMTPDAVDLARRPMQVNREWRPTAAASEAMMKTPWAIFETQGWRQEMGPNAAPHFRALYVDPDIHGNLMQKYGMGPGESLLVDTPETRAMTGVQRMTSVRLKSFRADLMDVIKSGNIKPGEQIGETLEGTPFHFEPSMRLTGFSEFATQGAGDFGTLYFQETVDAAEHTKIYGATKGMRRRLLSNEASQFAREAGMFAMNDAIGQGYETIISMEMLKKQPALHNTQMITDLWDLLNTMRTRDFVKRNTRLRNFMRNPTGYGALMNQWSGGSNYSHEKFVGNMMKLAGEARLTPQEFGSVFGAVPYVLGREKAQQMIGNEAYFQAASSGFSRGIAQSVFGGTKEETGAGALGSVEPRLFEMLEAGHMGELGGDLSGDIMRRIAATNPAAFDTHRALITSLESTLGKYSASGASFLAKDYSTEGFQAFIDRGGGTLSHPGMPDVYVPGATGVPAMGTFDTTAGKTVRSDLGNIFHNYARAIGNAESDEARQAALGGFRKALSLQAAPGGRGAGAFLRQKGIIGSRFLTGVSVAGGQRTTDMFSVGLPETHARQMFNELAEAGLYGKEALAGMRERFFAGESIQGMLLRHPLTSEYSAIPTNFQLLRGVDDPVMTLPWFNTELRLAGEAKRNPIMLSPMVGMGGDLDADIYAAFLVDPDLQGKISKQFTYANDEAAQAYIQHSIRTQLISAKAVGGKGVTEELSTFRKMVASGKKLATAQEWVGRLSNQFSEAREAINMHMSGQSAADARFLLRWLEEVPISGKHLKDKEVLENQMASFFETMESGFRTRDKGMVTGALQSIFSRTDTTTQKMLTEQVRIEEGIEDIRRLTGVRNFSDTLRGVEVAPAVSNLMDALALSDSSGATEALRMASGRKGVSERTVGTFLDNARGMMSRNSGVMSTVSSAAAAAKNFLGRAGQSMIKNKRAVGFGFAGSIALSMMLSSPQESIGPGSGLASAKVDMNQSKAGKRMSLPVATPEAPSPGQPSVPSMMQSSAMIAPGSDSVRMSVHARSQGRINGSMLAQRARHAGGRNTNVNVNIRDDSSSMNPHVLANKLF